MITIQEVKHIAELARLGISDDEQEKLRKELGSVLEMVDKLKQVDVSKVEISAHSQLIQNTMREDVVKKQEKETVDNIVSALPDKQGRHAKVKAVL
jgi:aspartyl-tRNA(Asn)/glutamyl-tRNA(Gln) amidotransferase subunit C